MFKDFPSLHPFAVHFPIVLILLAVAFQAIVVWKPSWQQVRWVSLSIMTVAFLSAWATSTIFHAEPAPDAPANAMAMFESHEKYAAYTLWASGITLLLKAIGAYELRATSWDITGYGSIVLGNGDEGNEYHDGQHEHEWWGNEYGQHERYEDGWQ